MWWYIVCNGRENKKKRKMRSYILTDRSLAVVIDIRLWPWTNGHPAWTQAKEALSQDGGWNSKSTIWLGMLFKDYLDSRKLASKSEWSGGFMSEASQPSCGKIYHCLNGCRTMLVFAVHLQRSMETSLYLEHRICLWLGRQFLTTRESVMVSEISIQGTSDQTLQIRPWRGCDDAPMLDI